VDKVQRLQVRCRQNRCVSASAMSSQSLLQLLQAEAEGEIGRLSSEMQQLQVRDMRITLIP
jgi:hypothetical protein